MLVINIGFITNSSSCVYCFPRELLEDPDIKAFINAYRLDQGFVGRDLQDGDQCQSLLLTQEQVDLARKRAQTVYEEDSGDVPTIPDAKEGVTVVFYDNLTTVFSELSRLLELKASERGLKLIHQQEYN